LGTGRFEVLAFVAALVIGIFAANAVRTIRRPREVAL
jgi:hypothetical protein